MTRHERYAATVGAGAAAFLLAVLMFVFGVWGFWVGTVTLVIAGGVAAATDPDKP